MTTDLIDWNLERAAEELTWANRAQARLYAYPQQYAYEIAECRYEVGMHIASANALIETRTQIGLLDAANTSRRAAQARVAELTEKVHARVDELTEKMQALGRDVLRHKLDAARYRLLRSAEGRGFPGIVVYEPDTGEMHVVTWVDADAAIDAAMSMEGGAA